MRTRTNAATLLADFARRGIQVSVERNTRTNSQGKRRIYRRLWARGPMVSGDWEALRPLRDQAVLLLEKAGHMEPRLRGFPVEVTELCLEAAPVPLVELPSNGTAGSGRRRGPCFGAVNTAALLDSAAQLLERSLLAEAAAI